MPAIHLFIDTNVWLSFFAFTKDDIDQLKKITDLIGNGTLKLYVPDQVAHEFTRNREVKLAESIKSLSDGFSKTVPRFLADLAEAKEFQEAVATMSKARNDLIQKANEGAVNKSFAVDNLVAEIFAATGISDVTPDMIDRARLRKDMGNPPGKGLSLGDQINWEYLLEKVPNESTLHVISRDGDYQSALKNGLPHNYLIDEWKGKKGGDLCLHAELKPFLNAHFEAIQLEIDKEKAAAINTLVESGSFASTHAGVSLVAPFVDVLTKDDANLLVEKGIENQQIHWIAEDTDVASLYQKILNSFEGQFSGSLEEDGKKLFVKSITYN